MSKYFLGKPVAFTIAKNVIKSPLEFGIERVDLMDWFHTIVATGRACSNLVIHLYTQLTLFIEFINHF